MDESHYTVYLPVVFAALLLVKILTAPPPYNKTKVGRGALFLALAGATFYVSLDDTTDRFKLVKMHTFYHLSKCAQ